MDRSRFYAALRRRESGAFGTSLSQGQVDGMESLLDHAIGDGTPLHHLAYILATAYHETARTMQPIAEIGKGRGRPYGKPAGPYGNVYYGRGYVQLTWLANYQKASQILGIDLVKYPERAMEPRIAAAILFRGMSGGWFTGKALDSYIHDGRADYVGARRIVNGTDRAGMIAGYAVAFEKALREAGYSAAREQSEAPTPSPRPDDPETGKRPSAKPAAGFLAAIVAALAALWAWLANLPCDLIGVFCQ